MRRMKYKIGAFCLLAIGLWGCLEDKGVYDYDFDVAPEIKIDTVGTDKTELFRTWEIGDTIHFTPRVTYSKPENLVYRWFVMDSDYKPETVGNTTVYPPADTISRTLDLNYVVSLEAGKAYQVWMMAKDTVYNTMGFFLARSYLTLPQAGSKSGIYCLQEKEGRVDVDVFGSKRTLIFSGSQAEEYWHEQDYWSGLHPEHPLDGEAKLIFYSTTGKWYYILTGQEALRCSPANMVIMDTWNDMFYSAPEYGPEAMMCVNNCDFLINNGRLHCLYIQSAGDRKFPVAMSGMYDLAPYLASATIAGWGAVTGAIGAYQVVFDKEQNGFRPFFNRASSLSRFSEADAEAVFDVNHMNGELVYSATVNGGETMAVMKRDGGYWMDVACFYNVVDNGKLARYSRSLAGCENLDRATCFTSTNAGSVLFYSVGNTLYSYSYTTGQTESVKVWNSDDDDEVVTCLYMIGTGGFPTAGRVLWAAVWNEKTQEGKIVEFEVSPTTGKIEDMYGPMFGGPANSPSIFPGFGKVISMTQTI